MSTVIGTKPSLEELQQIFRYGWRDVRRQLDDGTTRLESVPLTREDTLHPELGDHIVEGPMHDIIRMYLSGVFRSCLAVDKSAIVLSDCGVYWDDPRFDHHCPDITVVTGLENPAEILSEDSYSVKKFGRMPRLIVEIVSRHVRDNDVEEKFDIYHALKIPLYVIVDREKSDVDWKIVPYQYTPNRYFKLATDERGRFWIDFLGIWLGVENQTVVCYEGISDTILGDYAETRRQLQSEKQRAETEKQRAETEKQRADAEKQRADAEKQRAETEKQRAESEKSAREAAEAKVQQLEADLARLRGQ